MKPTEQIVAVYFGLAQIAKENPSDEVSALAAHALGWVLGIPTAMDELFATAEKLALLNERNRIIRAKHTEAAGN